MTTGQSPSSVRTLGPGVVIDGKYRIDRKIGEGGMGAVWVATHLGLGQQLAVKVISPEHARSEEARHRFDIEAKSAAKLRSRHVVQIQDNGELPDGTPYIVMELLEGESLSARMQRGGLTLNETAHIVTQVGRALDRAHGLGIIHRDIKPENVFLASSPDEEGYVVKVLDFGVAKVRGDDGVSTTRTGSILGTPLFMSPEQARGLKSVDHRTDLYSLGLLTFTMLTGQYAFEGESVTDLLLSICMRPLPSIHALAPWLPPSLDVWLQRACNREPELRFSAAREMMDAFHIAAGLSTAMPLADASSSAMVPAQAGVPGPLPFAPYGTSDPVVAQPTPGQSTGGFAPAPSMSIPDTEPQTPRRSMLPLVLGAIVLALLLAGSGIYVWIANNASSPGPTRSGEHDEDEGKPRKKKAQESESDESEEKGSTPKKKAPNEEPTAPPSASTPPKPSPPPDKPVPKPATSLTMGPWPSTPASVTAPTVKPPASAKPKGSIDIGF